MGCSSSRTADVRWSAHQLKLIRSLSLASLPPLSADPSNEVAGDLAAARLGHELFFDATLSANGSVSCASCHRPEKVFQDGLPRGKGLGLTPRRTMTILGAARQLWLFWDGRKDSLWSQALGPLESKLEQGMTRTEIVRRVLANDGVLYAKVFGKPPALAGLPRRASPAGTRAEQEAWAQMPTRQRERFDTVFANIGKAIAAYERRITIEPARFDEYADAAAAHDQKSMQRALSATEAHGLALFIGKAHCTDCHNGPFLTDGDFHNTGIASDDPGRIAAIATVLQDEFNCLGRFSDADPAQCILHFLGRSKPRLRGAFKPPSLRNVARRAPYMHAGTFGSLEKVVRHYDLAPPARVGHSEIHPLHLNASEQDAIVAFLRTLDSDPTAPEGFLVAP